MADDSGTDDRDVFDRLSVVPTPPAPGPAPLLKKKQLSGGARKRMSAERSQGLDAYGEEVIEASYMRKERITVDPFMTDFVLAAAIVAHALRTVGPDVDAVIEPSAGDGRFVKAARECWPDAFVQAIEPDPQYAQALKDAGADAVHVGTWESWIQTAKATDRVVVIGNPPYPVAGAHILLTLQRFHYWGGDAKWAFFILRNTMLAGVRRYKAIYGPLGRGGLHHVRYLIPRPAYGHGASEKAMEYVLAAFNSTHRDQWFTGDWLVWKDTKERLR